MCIEQSRHFATGVSVHSLNHIFYYNELTLDIFQCFKHQAEHKFFIVFCAFFVCIFFSRKKTSAHLGQ